MFSRLVQAVALDNVDSGELLLRYVMENVTPTWNVQGARDVQAD